MLVFSFMFTFVLYFCFLFYFLYCLFFFFKQKTAYEMRISDWSSDVCSSDLPDQFGRTEAGIVSRRSPASEHGIGFGGPAQRFCARVAATRRSASDTRRPLCRGVRGSYALPREIGRASCG